MTGPWYGALAQKDVSLALLEESAFVDVAFVNKVSVELDDKHHIHGGVLQIAISQRTFVPSVMGEIP